MVRFRGNLRIRGWSLQSSILKRPAFEGNQVGEGRMCHDCQRSLITQWRVVKVTHASIKALQCKAALSSDGPPGFLVGTVCCCLDGIMLQCVVDSNVVSAFLFTASHTHT